MQPVKKGGEPPHSNSLRGQLTNHGAEVLLQNLAQMTHHPPTHRTVKEFLISRLKNQDPAKFVEDEIQHFQLLQEQVKNFTNSDFENYNVSLHSTDNCYHYEEDNVDPFSYQASTKISQVIYGLFHHFFRALSLIDLNKLQNQDIYESYSELSLLPLNEKLHSLVIMALLAYKTQSFDFEPRFLQMTIVALREQFPDEMGSLLDMTYFCFSQPVWRKCALFCALLHNIFFPNTYAGELALARAYKNFHDNDYLLPNLVELHKSRALQHAVKAENLTTDKKEILQLKISLFISRNEILKAFICCDLYLSQIPISEPLPWNIFRNMACLAPLLDHTPDSLRKTLDYWNSKRVLIPSGTIFNAEYLTIELAIREEKFQEAAKCLQASFQKDPESLNLRYLNVLLLLKQNQLDRAAIELDELEKIPNKFCFFEYLKGIFYEKKGKLEEALQEFSKAIKKSEKYTLRNMNPFVNARRSMHEGVGRIYCLLESPSQITPQITWLKANAPNSLYLKGCEERLNKPKTYPPILKVPPHYVTFDEGSEKLDQLLKHPTSDSIRLPLNLFLTCVAKKEGKNLDLEEISKKLSKDFEDHVDVFLEALQAFQKTTYYLEETHLKKREDPHRKIPKNSEIFLDWGYVFLAAANHEDFHRALYCAYEHECIFGESLEGQLLLSRVYLELRSNDKPEYLQKALFYAKRAYILSKDKREAAKLIGKIYLYLEEFENAFRAFYEVSTLYTESDLLPSEILTYLYLAAEVLDHSGVALEKCLPFLARFNQIEPTKTIEKTQVKVLIANGQLQEGWELAQKKFYQTYLEKAARIFVLIKDGKFQEAATLLSVKEAFAKDRPEQREFLLGALREKEGYLLEAVEYYSDAIQKNTKYVPISWHLAKCRVLANKGLLEVMDAFAMKDSLNYLSKNIPENGEYLNYAFKYAYLKGEEDAIQRGLICLEKNPNNFVVYTLLIDFCRENGNEELACKLAQKAFERRMAQISEQSTADLVLAHYLFDLGFIQEAKQIYEHFLTPPQSEDSFCFKLYLLKKCNQLQEFEEEAQRYLKAHPESSEVHYMLALFYFDQGVDDSKTLNEIAFVLQKGNQQQKIQAFKNRISIFAKKEKWGKVVADYEELRKLKASVEPEILENVFQAYLKVGKFSQAEMLLKMDSFNPEKVKQLSAELEKKKPKKSEKPLEPVSKTVFTQIPVVLPQPKAEPIPEIKIEEEEEVKKPNRVKKVKEDKWRDPRISREVTVEPPPRKIDQEEIERRKLKYYISLAEELSKQKHLPEEVVSQRTKGTLQIVCHKPVDELKQAIVQQHSKPVSEVLPLISEKDKDRLALAHDSIIKIGDLLTRYGKSEDPFAKYLLERGLLYNVMKMCEAFFSTGSEKLDDKYKSFIREWLLLPEIAHQLRNEVRNEFQKITLLTLVKGCQTLCEGSLQSNLQACLQYHDPRISMSEKKQLLLHPKTILPTHFTLCGEGMQNGVRERALEELNYLNRMHEKTPHVILKENDYLEAAKMSICILQKCLQALNFKKEDFHRSLTWFGNFFAHGIPDGYFWGGRHEIDTNSFLTFISKVPTLIQKIKL